MAKYVIIDGIEYKVPIIEMTRSADILDKYANRSEDGVLHREVIGTYYNYELKIGVINDLELYNKLFAVLSEPVESHIVEFPHDKIRYEAYFSSVSDEINKVMDNGTRFRGLSCKCTAMRPARRPIR